MTLETYNNNINWLCVNKSRCFINPEISQSVYQFQTVISKTESVPSLIVSVASKDWEIVDIHSEFAPLKEAEQIAGSLVIHGDELVVLGLGLGYVATAIRKRFPDKKLILIEPDKQVFYLALKHIDLAFLDFTAIYVGYDDAGINAVRPLFSAEIYTQKSIERLYPEKYARIKAYLQKSQKHSLSEKWRYQKFTADVTRILFIDSGYVLSKECLTAIQKTGNLARYIHIDTDNYDYEIFIKRLLNDIIEFKPDFVLTINHLGFDKEGRLTQLFSDIELPFVSWFVDSPNVVLSSYDLNISDFCNIFVWDDIYIPQLKEKGYHSCEYLPLATDTSIFYPKKVSHKYNVSFVGSSMTFAVHKNMQSWVHRDDLQRAFPEKVQLFLAAKTLVLKGEEAGDISYTLDDLYFDNSDQREDFAAAVLWRATQIYRQSGIDKLADFMPAVSGDPNWSNMLTIEYETLSERWYYEDLCDFYNQSRISFNMTSLQMTHAVNQRVFDVPATGGFLLTDYRKQVAEFFETKDNLVWFDNVEEIPSLLKFYLDNEKERKRISDSAYSIVTKNHTYDHRIKKMIEIMKKKYK
ncbi:MAG: glycosyltransferase [Candidatus Cloacimonetes bacterium]|nr:glycosyltransferase [Candidatus Cloacimonadota bacterium]